MHSYALIVIINNGDEILSIHERMPRVKFGLRNRRGTKTRYGLKTRRNTVQIRSETEPRDHNSALMSVCSMNDLTGPFLNTVARTESNSRLCTLRPLSISPLLDCRRRVVRPETIVPIQQRLTAAGVTELSATRRANVKDSSTMVSYTNSADRG